jgi:hypothetical protein
MPLSQQYCLVFQKTRNFSNAGLRIANLSSKTLLLLSPTFPSLCRFEIAVAVQQGARGAVGL